MTPRYSYALYTTALYSTARYSYSRYSDKKIEISNIFAVFLLGIPIPDIYTTFLHN